MHNWTRLNLHIRTGWQICLRDDSRVLFFFFFEHRKFNTKSCKLQGEVGIKSNWPVRNTENSREYRITATIPRLSWRIQGGAPQDRASDTVGEGVVTAHWMAERLLWCHSSSTCWKYDLRNLPEICSVECWRKLYEEVSLQCSVAQKVCRGKLLTICHRRCPELREELYGQAPGLRERLPCCCRWCWTNRPRYKGRESPWAARARCWQRVLCSGSQALERLDQEPAYRAWWSQEGKPLTLQCLFSALSCQGITASLLREENYSKGPDPVSRNE